MTDLGERVRAWVAEDPDAEDRQALESLLASADPASRAELADRFAARLAFGTAGLRGAVDAGPNRMNRAVVRATTVALVRWLADHSPDSETAGVVVGCDARHRSKEFADEVTAVLAGGGVRVHRLEDHQPTPLLAFAVRHLGAAAGVMITASHNPAGDNGYKLYLADGAQIIPPVDAEIEALIAEVGPLSLVPVGDLEGPLVVRHGQELAAAYLEVVVRGFPAPAGADEMRVVYTPLHGVAGELVAEALRRAGYPPPLVVTAQGRPDPDFPTVAFPNPEEPGALDLAFADGRRHNAHLIVANDPDGDRFAVAVPDPVAGDGWRRLTGDEVGVLLGAYVLERTRAQSSPADRLVAASVVSCTMLARIAAAEGVHFVTTLTGFKWIVRATEAVPGSRFVFGYEEALGYDVGDVVRDKDGVGAALAFLALAAGLQAQGSTLLARLDELAATHGVHLTAQLSLRHGSPGSLMGALRAKPPTDIAGLAVEEILDLSGGVVWQPGLPPLPPADVLAYRLSDGGRLIVRPSGTEAKLKAYLEVAREPEPDVQSARAGAGAVMDRLLDAVPALLGE